MLHTTTHPDLQGEIVLLFDDAEAAPTSAGAAAPIFRVAAFDAEAGRLHAAGVDAPGLGWSTPAVRCIDGAIAARAPLPAALYRP